MQIPAPSPSVSHDPFYKTSDLQVSTILVLTGHSLRNVERNKKRAIYVFQNATTIHSTIAEFYQGALRLNPKELFDIWKGLRGMAYSIIENDEGGPA